MVVVVSAGEQPSMFRAGDKPAEFIDSKQWIGSMEVGFYLDSELGITWRNIFTSTGPELAEKVRSDGQTPPFPPVL
jgi:hypothetical protein